MLSRNAKLLKLFSERFGNQFRTVGAYFSVHGKTVQIHDVSSWLSELAQDLVTESFTDATTD